MSQHASFPEHALDFRFVHASGPGGQHVNKASTAVELRVNLAALGLPMSTLRRLRQQQSGRINKRGELIIFAEQFRSQLKNRKAAIGRLESMVHTASIKPKPRIATKPSKASQRKRVESKKQRGQTKNNRRKPQIE